MNIIKSAEVDRFINEMNSSGIDYFSLGIIKGDSAFVVFSCPQWQQFYLESECLEFDPLVRAALANVGIPIDWHSVAVTRKKHSLIMQKRQELTGCAEGFSIVKKISPSADTSDDTFALLAFGSRGSFSELAAAYLKHQDRLLKLVEMIHQDLI